MTKDEALKMAIEAMSCISQSRGDPLLKAVRACKEALKQPQCNPHPKAPHGFSRDASHNADRYVCDCEGWDAWQDGYEEGLRKGLELEQPAQEPVALKFPTMLRKMWSGTEVQEWLDKQPPLYTNPAPQPAQEPVAWLSENSSQVTKWKDIAQSWIQHGGKAIPLYTHPAPSWQGLSDDEITKAVSEMPVAIPSIFGIARAIEQALKEKNT